MRCRALKRADSAARWDVRVVRGIVFVATTQMSLRRALVVYGTGVFGTFVGLQYCTTLKIIRDNRMTPGLVDSEIAGAAEFNAVAAIGFPFTWIAMATKWKAERDA